MLHTTTQRVRGFQGDMFTRYLHMNSLAQPGFGECWTNFCLRAEKVKEVLKNDYNLIVRSVPAAVWCSGSTP